MATALVVYAKAVESCLSGTLELDNGDVGVALYITKTAIDHNDSVLSDITDTEADAGSPPVTNYTRKTQTVTVSGGNISTDSNVVTFDLEDFTWSTLGAEGDSLLQMAILYKDVPGPDNGKDLIAHMEIIARHRTTCDTLVGGSLMFTKFLELTNT